MSWSVILGLFDQSIPIGIVAIIVFQAVMSRDIKHIRKDLDNHITDTNKKIEDINKKIDKLDSKFDKIMGYLLRK